MDRLEVLISPGLRFDVASPDGVGEIHGAAAALEQAEPYYGSYDSVTVVDRQVGYVAGRPTVTLRLRMVKDGEAFLSRRERRRECASGLEH